MICMHAERLRFFAPGSAEDMKTNLLKSFEREATHKPLAHQWTTVDPETYRCGCAMPAHCCEGSIHWQGKSMIMPWTLQPGLFKDC